VLQQLLRIAKDLPDSESPADNRASGRVPFGDGHQFRFGESLKDFSLKLAQATASDDGHTQRLVRRGGENLPAGRDSTGSDQRMLQKPPPVCV
jgi:hypothetical protein